MPNRKNENSHLAKIASNLVSDFRKHGITYDQSRYVFKRARLVLDLKPAKRGQRVPKCLSEAQLEKFFASITNPTDLVLFKLTYSCALRVSAVCELQKDDVNLDDLTITVRFNKTNGGVIPFPRNLKPLLQMHLQSSPGNASLFESTHRKPFCTRTLQLKFKHYAKLAGLPQDLAIHSLRHSSLSHLAAKGLTSSQLQGVSLHRSKASLDSYVRLSAVEVRAAYDHAMK